MRRNAAFTLGRRRRQRSVLQLVCQELGSGPWNKFGLLCKKDLRIRSGCAGPKKSAHGCRIQGKRFSPEERLCLQTFHPRLPPVRSADDRNAFRGKGICAVIAISVPRHSLMGIVIAVWHGSSEECNTRTRRRSVVRRARAVLHCCQTGCSYVEASCCTGHYR